MSKKKTKSTRKKLAVGFAFFALLAGVIFYQGPPTEIHTLQDLDDVRLNLSGHYILMADIDASDTSNPSSPFWNGGLGWDPIGLNFPSPVFAGTFDGNGHIISNLFIDRPLEGNTGLFGNSSGDIFNLGLEDVNITGSIRTGALVGNGEAGPGGNINQVYATGEVTTVNGGDSAGLVGHAYATWITNSYSRVNITMTGTSVSSFGAAGLTGYLNAPLGDSYSTGTITNLGSGYTYNAPLVNLYVAGVTSDSFWDTEASGLSCTGFPFASCDPGAPGGQDTIPKTTAEMKQESTFLAEGWDFTTIWTINPLVNDGYPSFPWQNRAVPAAPPALEVTAPPAPVAEDPTPPRGIPAPVAAAVAMMAATSIVAIYVIKK